MTAQWHILTGEYPPQPGGVADYSRSVARALAAVGDAVIVWAPQCCGLTSDDAGVEVRRLPGHFGPRALARLDRSLRRQPGRVLLQYTPHAFGYKAMNVPLCAWLWARRRHLRLDVMFHEVAFPFAPGQPRRHTLLAAVHRAMACLLLHASERVFVSIPGWEPLLDRLGSGARRPVWAPVPSNLPTACPAKAVAAVRGRLLADSAARLVGHFGTYGPLIRALLEPALRAVLQSASDVRALLLGRGGPAFVAELQRTEPALAGRLLAPGELDGPGVAEHLACCDVMLQPYPDGISARRGSAMAALALGLPIVTTEGVATEPIWRSAGAVAFTAPTAMAPAVLELLRAPGRRHELGTHAARLYRSRFAVEHTVHTLRHGVGSLAPSFARHGIRL